MEPVVTHSSFLCMIRHFVVTHSSFLCMIRHFVVDLPLFLFTFQGLTSNFSSVESQLANSLSNLFLLSETQLSSQTSPDPFQISYYKLYSRFRSKGSVCAYSNINKPITRLMDLESPHFGILWLKIYLPTTTIILCFCYCSPNSINFPLSI